MTDNPQETSVQSDQDEAAAMARFFKSATREEIAERLGRLVGFDAGRPIEKATLDRVSRFADWAFANGVEVRKPTPGISLGDPDESASADECGAVWLPVQSGEAQVILSFCHEAGVCEYSEGDKRVRVPETEEGYAAFVARAFPAA
jgi:hypothetical protein